MIMNSLNHIPDSSQFASNPTADILKNSSITIERPVVNEGLLSLLQNKVGNVSYHQLLRSIADEPIDIGKRPFLEETTKELVSRIPELAQELREIKKSQQLWRRACGLFIGNPEIDDFFKNHAALGLAVQEMLSAHLLIDSRRLVEVSPSSPVSVYPVPLQSANSVLVRFVSVSDLGLQALDA
jgi:hypothetical protein